MINDDKKTLTWLSPAAPGPLPSRPCPSGWGRTRAWRRAGGTCQTWDSLSTARWLSWGGPPPLPGIPGAWGTWPPTGWPGIGRRRGTRHPLKFSIGVSSCMTWFPLRLPTNMLIERFSRGPKNFICLSMGRDNRMVASVWAWNTDRLIIYLWLVISNFKLPCKRATLTNDLNFISTQWCVSVSIKIQTDSKHN